MTGNDYHRLETRDDLERLLRAIDEAAPALPAEPERTRTSSARLLYVDEPLEDAERENREVTL